MVWLRPRLPLYGQLYKALAKAVGLSLLRLAVLTLLCARLLGLPCLRSDDRCHQEWEALGGEHAGPFPTP
ncbi:MAG: hypothetical protein NZ651_02050 [Candidatus Bipolaricaulota bacterium]|nr:hypothetical protein [Candidatus Bipolaricaulota bacterium]MDW8126540.1 hypothetical protein [Candidatus Bipolaricaulota bacterium]